MERIRCISITHRSAPVELREKIRVEAGDIRRILAQGAECFWLNTCNRTEVYWTGLDTGIVYDMLSVGSGIDRRSLEAVSELLSGGRAVGHLFSVASGLDSLVLGETQILGQVKDAYREALASGTTGTILNKALHRAFRAAKRVRTETGVGAYPVSVASQAVELAEHVFGDAGGSSALVVGAGEMAAIAARRLKDRGARSLRIVNRTYDSACSLACELGGVAGRFEDLVREIALSDIVISSTGASSPIITRDMVAQAMRLRRNRPLIIVDIALPRDVEEGARDCYNCYIYDIDALQAIVNRHFAEREAEAEKARAIVEEEVATFSRWLRSLSAQATIQELYALMDALAEEQTRAMAGTGDGVRVEQALRSAYRRLLHRPVSFLKEHPDARHIEYVRRVFKLDDDHTDRHKG
jgi:glutamyl-tRNA reductase